MDNPLQLAAALQMAVLFQVVLWGVYVARQTWGESGVLTSAAVLGLTDVDALTISMTRGVAQNAGVEITATAIAVGVLSKRCARWRRPQCSAAPGFRTIAGGALLLIAAALAAGVLTFQL